MGQLDVDSILVVDEGTTDSSAVVEMLIREGYRVQCASDAGSVLERTRSTMPFVILLDGAIPGGYECCRRLKADPAVTGIPVIFMTPPGAPRTDGFAAGGTDHVAKPFEHDEVLARVRTHAKLRQLQLLVSQLEQEKRDLQQALWQQAPEEARAAPGSNGNGNGANGNGNGLHTLVEVERRHFKAVLTHTRGVIEGPNGAARMLDLKPSTARFRLRKLGIKREDFVTR